jgi:hypothetical protein
VSSGPIAGDQGGPEAARGNVGAPVSLVDLGRALGRDMPASLKRSRELAARIRKVSQTPPAKKGR